LLILKKCLDKKRPAQRFCAGLFIQLSGLSGADGINRTCVYTCAAINAGVSIDYTLVTLLADGAYWTGVVTCTAVDALVGNLVSQRNSPPFF
jgi:hypothetical protein